MILFKLEDERSYAVPLSLIDRLEEFDTSRIEWSGNQALIRYRNASMPLVNVEKILNLKGESVINTREGGKINCIVTKVNGVFFGIVVSEIIDIAMSESPLESDTVDRDGLLGTIYIDEKLITLLDLFEIVNRTEVGKKLFAVDMSKKLNGRVLVVEDGTLYRRVYQDILNELGVQATIARNGVEGYDFFKKDNNYDMVITDIEMPLKNGPELAEDIKKLNENIPILAVSSKVDDKIGKLEDPTIFTEALEKLNKKEFVDILSKYLS